MGMRLSLYVLPKEKAKEMWLMQSDDSLWEHIDQLEQIAHDFCTDAMWDVCKQMKRLTKSKLEIECDVVIGKMSLAEFDIFLDRIKWYAERQIRESDNPLFWWDIIRPSDNEWRLCQTQDWIGAYFQGWYIRKKMDWENNYILFDIG